MTDQRYDSLAAALDVTADVLDRRALDLFERESGRVYPAPIVLCGTGRLGRITLAGLRRAGVEPVAIADNNVRVQGSRIDGMEVLSVPDAVQRFAQDAVFVTTIYTARPLRDQLASLGARVASCRALFFHHPRVFLPHGSIQWPSGILDDAKDALSGLSAWSDDASRDEYVAQINWQLLLATEMPAWLPASETYFPHGLVRLSDHESVVDCGAFDGDTLRAVLDRTGGRFEHFLGLEPDPGNHAKLAAFVDALPAGVRSRISTRQVAVHAERATLRFESGDGAGSNLTEAGDLEVQAERLDEIVGDLAPTFLKMDIEGAEPLAISGARQTLRRHSPTLAICLYHRREHLWEVPRLIIEANPRYRLSLRRHSDESWETVCYGVAQ
jgi:FkbM family methyltransferase